MRVMVQVHWSEAQLGSGVRTAQQKLAKTRTEAGTYSSTKDIPIFFNRFQSSSRKTCPEFRNAYL